MNIIYKRVLLHTNQFKLICNSYNKLLSANYSQSSPDLIFSKKTTTTTTDKENNKVSSSEKADNISRAMIYYLEKLNERGINFIFI
jgi:hypothetical protein